jgi:membrane carboxypeptidase/penicillin-binding protein
MADRRRPRGSGAGRYVAVAVPLFLFLTLLLLGFAGATTVVAGYSFLSKDLPDPAKALEAIVYDQQTGVYDRTGNVLLARLGSDRRELVTYKDIPPELVDATTSI